MTDIPLVESLMSAAAGFGASTHTTRCIDGLRNRAAKHSDDYLLAVADEILRVYRLIVDARSALSEIANPPSERDECDCAALKQARDLARTALSLSCYLAILLSCRGPIDNDIDISP